jgi:hypothetical protein
MDPTQSSGTAGDQDQTVAWRAVPEDTEVRAGGQAVGTVYDLLGSHEEDIFHGIVVKLHKGRRRVFVGADDVLALTTTHVDVDMTPDEIDGLPDHTDEGGFELGMVGHFRKHVGWVKEKDR